MFGGALREDNADGLHGEPAHAVLPLMQGETGASADNLRLDG
jgi:hypothetical protein